MDVVVERSYNLVDLLSATEDILDINREIEEYLAKFENEISEPIPEFEKGKIDNYRPLQNITWAITGWVILWLCHIGTYLDAAKCKWYGRLQLAGSKRCTFSETMDIRD